MCSEKDDKAKKAGKVVGIVAGVAVAVGAALVLWGKFGPKVCVAAAPVERILQYSGWYLFGSSSQAFMPHNVQLVSSSTILPVQVEPVVIGTALVARSLFSAPCGI